MLTGIIIILLHHYLFLQQAIPILSIPGAPLPLLSNRNTDLRYFCERAVDYAGSYRRTFCFDLKVVQSQVRKKHQDESRKPSALVFVYPRVRL